MAREKPQPPKVPSEELHLPLSERSRPFLPATPEQVGAPRAEQERREVTLAIEQALVGVEDMIFKFARKHFNHVGENMVDEAVQACRTHLWNYSLPRYQRVVNGRPVRSTTFLHHCIQAFMYQHARLKLRIGKRPRREISFTDVDTADRARSWVPSSTAPDESQDDHIAAIAQHVLNHPEKYLTPCQVEVFQVMVNNEGLHWKIWAKRLGYKRPSSMSMMMRRIRERLTALIDIEGWRPDRPICEGIAAPTNLDRLALAQTTEIRRRLAAGQRSCDIAREMNVPAGRVYDQAKRMKGEMAKAMPLAA